MQELSLFIDQYGILLIGALLVLSVWALVWKGYALWYSARNGHRMWFIVLLLVNTLGILEIIYIFAVARKKEREAAPSVQPPLE